MSKSYDFYVSFDRKIDEMTLEKNHLFMDEINTIRK